MAHLIKTHPQVTHVNQSGGEWARLCNVLWDWIEFERVGMGHYNAWHLERSNNGVRRTRHIGNWSDGSGWILKTKQSHVYGHGTG